jgi:hypothetical protein
LPPRIFLVQIQTPKLLGKIVITNNVSPSGCIDCIGLLWKKDWSQMKSPRGTWAGLGTIWLLTK